MQLHLIASVARNGVIGSSVKNDMVWFNKEDMVRFKALTLGHPVIMGRKTWDSLPQRYRPLPGRYNIVLSKQNLKLEGAHVMEFLSDAIAHLKPLGQEFGVLNTETGNSELYSTDRVWVIGGGEIYTQTIQLAHRLHITEIDQDLEGDVKFPDIDKTKFKETQRDQREGFAFVTYDRML